MTRKRSEGGEGRASKRVSWAIKGPSLVGDMIESPSFSSVPAISPSPLPFLAALFSLSFFIFFSPFPVIAMADQPITDTGGVGGLLRTWNFQSSTPAPLPPHTNCWHFNSFDTYFKSRSASELY